MIKIFQKFDWSIFVPVIMLIFVGMMAILSTTWKEGRAMEFVDKQIIGALMGIALIFLLSTLNYQIFGSWAYLIYFLTNTALLFVLFFGTEIRGTRGWFDLGFFQLQPSEFAKVSLLIILAKYFSSISGKPSRFQYLVVSGVLTLIPTMLVLLQPDLGTALILIFLWLAMLLVSGIKKEYVLTLILAGVVLFWGAWSFAFAPYQKERILTFINPERDPLGSGYHMIQSKIAIGSGGIFGRGLGHGPQSQLKFLPDEHTDFIFAVVAEELGFLGAALLLALLGFLLFRILKIARGLRDEFGLVFSLGAIFLFLIQIFINIGMNLGILPVTGVPLPLVSYGGSALLVTLIILGILENMAFHARTAGKS